MPTSRKIIILVSGLVLIGLAFWLIILRPSGDGDSVQTNGRQPNSNSETIQPENSQPKIIEQLQPLSAQEREERELEVFITQFIERWGSYSNQDDFTSIRDLSSQGTRRLQGFIDSYISDLQSAHPYQQGYFGLSTKVVTVELAGFSLGASRFSSLVGTRREESVGSQNRSFNQEVEVRLIKSGGDWFVDGVFWK